MTVYMVAQVPHAWYSSPEYAKALAFRQAAVQRRLFFAQGTDELPAAGA